MNYMSAYTVILYPYTAPHSARHTMTVAARNCTEARSRAYEQVRLCRDSAQPYYVECWPADRRGLQLSLFGESGA